MAELARLRKIERAAQWLIETEPFREPHCGGAPDCAIDTLRAALEDA